MPSYGGAHGPDGSNKSGDQGQGSRDSGGGQTGGGGGGFGGGGFGRTDGRHGPQGRANPAQRAGTDRGATPGGGAGKAGDKGIVSKAFDAVVNPVKEDPVLNAGIKAMPVVGALASVAAMLDAAGVPNTPANTGANYQDSQTRSNTGVGQGGAGDVIESMNPMAPPPIPQPIGYQKQTIYTSDGSLPKIDKVPIYPRVVSPNSQFPTNPNAASSRIVSN